MTPDEIREIVDRHHALWLSSDPLATDKVLQDHMTDAVNEALAILGKRFQKGADTLRWERDQALAASAKMVEEVEVLRTWGNKDCTKMADEDLRVRYQQRCRTGTPPHDINNPPFQRHCGPAGAYES